MPTATSMTDGASSTTMPKSAGMFASMSDAVGARAAGSHAARSAKGVSVFAKTTTRSSPRWSNGMRPLFSSTPPSPV